MNQASHHSDNDDSAPQRPTSRIAPDCRHYRGEKPCLHNRLCQDCEHYNPHQDRICVIKLGALGDVIRTLSILPELRRRFPSGQITWVTLPNAARMIENHEQIDRVVPLDGLTAMVLMKKEFELLINLDKEAEPCALAMSMFARQKLGIGLSEFGTPIPMNREAQNYMCLGMSDELEFVTNTKSYPQLIYEALGWDYEGQRYELPRNEEAANRLRRRLSGLGWRPDRATLGVNVGAGENFANKSWPIDRLTELINIMRRQRPDQQILLLGGPTDRPMVDQIKLKLGPRPLTDPVIDPGTDFDEPTFLALVDACDVVFSGDTMAMHAAIALGKGVVAWFGPTCPQEIDLFELGEKLVADVPCAPCYKQVCDQDDVCVQAVSIDQAVNAIGRVMGQVRDGDTPLPVLPTRIAG